MNYSIIIRAAVVVSAVAVSACASRGTPIEQADVKKIIPGTTTKQDMYNLFGQPLSQAYGTDGKLTMIWHYVHVGPFGTGMQTQSLAVLFDQQERVEKFNLIDSHP